MKSFLFHLGLLVLMALVLAIWMALPWAGTLALVALLALWMAATRSGRQAGAVTAVGLGTLRGRLGSSSVIVIGIAGVVGVLVALLAMGEGFRATLQSGGRDDTAIVLRGGSVAETQSVLLHDDIVAIAQAPGVARDASGKPLVSGELVVDASVHEKAGGDANAQLRGVDDTAWTLRPDLKLIAGRRFKPGLHELVVGQGAHRQFAGLDVGDVVRLGREDWRVVGVFASGDAYDSELWADRQTVAAIYRRGDSAESVLVKLATPDAYTGFKTALAGDPRLKVEVATTREFFARQSESLARVIRAVGIVVGTIMGLGAVFGALNCMFAAVAGRAREIATLRALGFRGGPVVASVMLETMALALLGGLIGAAFVWLLFDGYRASTLQGFTDVMFRFAVTPALMWTGLKWALAIGFIGGLFPAVRAARLSVTAALREL
ncbi:ABC transporter permease [Aerosticca soli]|uniref:ABC-type antimicrobial peptide transport system, permease component n=1 Tax=Aerosticca soli TaxID=2010829 RepID=A0A2Z6E5K1_9GAMM|nr:ABC transporter permease [Aerosticca soli]BBD80333.1 ABC-type antimicrobial peptide transport system, permease component [Aerosticca soli]